jgi:hypothetical protein
VYGDIRQYQDWARVFEYRHLHLLEYLASLYIHIQKPYQLDLSYTYRCVTCLSLPNSELTQTSPTVPSHNSQCVNNISYCRLSSSVTQSNSIIVSMAVQQRASGMFSLTQSLVDGIVSPQTREHYWNKTGTFAQEQPLLFVSSNARKNGNVFC